MSYQIIMKKTTLCEFNVLQESVSANLGSAPHSP